MAGLASLFVRVGADITGYRKGMDEVTGTARKAAKEIPAAMAVASAAIIAIGATTIKMAVDAEREMGKVATLIPGQADRLNQYRAAIEKYSIATGKSFSDLAEGAYQTISAFGDTADSINILGIAARASAAGFSSTIDAVNLISLVTKGYGDTSTAAAQKVADLAFLTVKLGQTTFPELASSMGGTVPLAAKLGVTIEELTALFSTLTGVTGSTAEVATQLESLFTSLIKPTDGMKESLDKLHVSSGAQLIQQYGLVESFKQLIDSTDGSDAAYGRLMESKRGLVAAFALTGAQADVFADKLRQHKAAANELDEAFSELEKTTAFKLEQAMRKAESAGRDLGNAFLPLFATIIDGVNMAFGPLAEGLHDVIQGAQEWLDVLLGGTKAIREQAQAINTVYVEALKLAKLGVENLTEAQHKQIIEAFRRQIIGLQTEINAYPTAPDMLQTMFGGAHVLNEHIAGLKRLEEKLAEVKAEAKSYTDEWFRFINSGGKAREEVKNHVDAWAELEEKLRAGAKNTDEMRRGFMENRKALEALIVQFRLGKEALPGLLQQAESYFAILDSGSTTAKKTATTVAELRESWESAGKQLRIDIAATGDQTRVLYLHRGALEPLIRSYREWGLALPPLLAEADRLFKIQDENARVNAELEKRLEGVTAELTQQEMELQLVIPEWERYLPLYAQLAAAIRLVHAAQAEGGSVAADPATLVPPQSWFGKLGDAMGLAFQDGFAQSFKSNSDVKQAVQAGLGQAISAGLTAALGPAAANPIVASFIQVIGASVGKWLGSGLFGEKLTNEQLAKGYGEAFAKQFGIAFNAEFEQALMQAASRIPAVRDRIDASVARFMPEMISQILAQVDSLTPQIQASLAESIGHGVNYLMEKGGLSHKKAFEAFLPQFGEIVRQALAGGQALDQGILNLIGHARNLGVDFSELGSVFAGALEELLSGTEISAEGLRNLAEMAAAVGVDIADVFAEALDDFIDSEDFSIEKMEQLAAAARAAGLDVSEALTEAIRDARAELEDLDQAARDIGAEILDAFIRKLDLKGAGQELREKFVGGRTEGIEDEARLAAEREAAQARFNELKAKARAIDIDGKKDAKDIREAIKGLPDDEAKIVLELAKQRLERKAAREEIKRHRKEQKLANEQLEAQNRLVTALENLFKNLDSPMEQNKTTAEEFAGALGAAETHLQGIKTIWEWLANHPLDLPKGGSDAGMFSTGSGAGVFTAGFGGGSAPTAQFGGQQFSASAAAAGGHGGPPIIIAPQVHIDAIDAKSLQERGVDLANAVAVGVKRGLSQLHPSIVRGN